MPSDMREAVAEAMCDLVNHQGDFAEHKDLRLPGWGPVADAALAVIRERLAEKVPAREPLLYGLRGVEIDLNRDWNACRAAMLRELGGEG